MNLRIYEFAVSQVMSASKISRRELMSSIAVMFGMSAARASGFDGQRASPRQPARDRERALDRGGGQKTAC